MIDRLRSSSVHVAAAAGVALLAAGAPARATDLSQVLVQYFEDGIRLSANSVHAGHFEDSGAARQTAEQLNLAIASQFATSPLGSSSGGMTFSYDDETGTFVRSSDSYGPLFAERALTLGKGKWSFGATYVHRRFDSIEGFGLRNGDLTFTLQHEDEFDPAIDPPSYEGNLYPFFEGDLIDTRLNLGLSIDTAYVYLNYGVTKNLDLGIVLPFVKSTLDATFDSTILPLSGAGVHFFDDPASGSPTLFQSETRDESATGLGDVILRLKWVAFSSKGVNGALGADVRTPTGDEANFLGTGSTQVKGYFTLSGKVGSFWPHGSLGYTASFGSSDITGEIADEILYNVGFDQAIHPKVTFAADLIGRTLLDARRLVRTTTPYQYNTNPDPGPRIGTIYRDTITPYSGDVTLLDAALGFKINVARGLLLNLGALVNLSKDKGLADELSLTLGMDYNF